MRTRPEAAVLPAERMTLIPLSLTIALLTACCLCCLHIGSVGAQVPSLNILRGIPAKFESSPNYGHCTDPEDHLQLTDGKYGGSDIVQGTSSLWMQKETVGWTNKSLVVISFDLGKVQPIEGVSVSTAGGIAGVIWPEHIFMWLSNDNSSWHNAGDLIELSRAKGEPPTDRYSLWRYTANQLGKQARYVSFVVTAMPYFFCDEIEIYRGDDELLKTPLQIDVTGNIQQLVVANTIHDRIIRRLKSDHEDVSRKLASSRLKLELLGALRKELDATAIEIETLRKHPKPIDPNFRAVLPLNALEARILAVHGAAIGGAHPGLKVWKQHRYQWLPLMATPSQTGTPTVRIGMLKNEKRADTLLLTNASAKPLAVRVKIGGLKGRAANALQISSAAWTDTWQGKPVATALIETVAGDLPKTITIPAGMTYKLWLAADSASLTTGVYRGTVEITAADAVQRVPLTLKVSKVAMPRPRLALQMWDYTDGPAFYGMTPVTRPLAIQMMRDNYVDSPWAQPTVLPFPQANDFAADGRLTKALDFTKFDQWLAMWYDARRYFIYLDVPTIPEFAGAKPGSEEFAVRVGSWAKEIVRHLKEKNKEPGSLHFLLVDEPNTDEQAALIVQWATAIKSAAPELKLFEDPNWQRPDLVKEQKALTAVDILSPNLGFLHVADPAVLDYYQKRREAGQELWLYQAMGPVHTMDPTTYYRQQSWHAFKLGATGIGFWAFGDSGGTPSSWNDYLAQSQACTPVFIDTTTVTNSIHWEAVREGVQDYEYLALLRDKIAAAPNGAWKKRATTLLADLPTVFDSKPPTDHDWRTNATVDAVDRYRLRVIELLETAPE